LTAVVHLDGGHDGLSADLDRVISGSDLARPLTKLSTNGCPTWIAFNAAKPTTQEFTRFFHSARVAGLVEKEVLSIIKGFGYEGESRPGSSRPIPEV
jgi:hypothetical protein